MIIRLLPFFLFFISIAVSNVSCQQLVKRMQNLYDNNGIKTKQNSEIKKIVSRKYSLRDSKVKFNLDLLKYHQESNYSKAIHTFDNQGNITLVENNYKGTSIITGDFFSGSEKLTWTYSDGILLNYTYTSTRLDSISQEESNLTYEYDDNDRIVKIKEISSLYGLKQVEEIEYNAEGKKSTLYSIKDDFKKKSIEYFYDLNDNIIIIKNFKANSRPGSKVHFFSKYLYDSQGKLIEYVYIPRKPQSYEGSFIEHNYSDNGVLEEVNYYELLIETTDGVDHFSRGRRKSKVKYKEKVEDGYILQTQKSKAFRKNSICLILDHKRNVILIFDRHSNTVLINDITYLR